MKNINKHRFYLTKYFYYKLNKNNHKQKKYFKKLDKSDNTYKIRVKEPWFTFIKNGQKKVEGRLNVGLFKKLQVGDIIEWENSDNKFKTTISKIIKYESFQEMIKKEDINNVLPDISTLEDGVNIYRQFYTESNEKQYGVVAIHLVLL